MVEKFEGEVENLNKKLEEGERYRHRSVFPTVSSVITRYHKELMVEIEKHKEENSTKNSNGDTFSLVGPYTELDTMMIYQGQVIVKESGANIKWGWG